MSFADGGDAIVTAPDQADVLVLNTCAVTREAVRKSRQRVQRLQRANPAARVVVSGCYSTLESPTVMAELGIDLVVPNTHKDQLVTLTRQAFAQPDMPEGATVPAESALFQRNRHRAFIKIQDGCRYRCTFCIVTVARGSERSRTIDEIVTEVQRLDRKGVQEIVLTGVHVGGYGRDLDEQATLFSLVSALLADTDMPRIRFASVEPWDLSAEFLTVFNNPRVQPHVHLPLQSGCDSVLKRMARRCRTADFATLAADLRSCVDGFNITTDIIVGFPGESDQEWRESMEFISRMEFGQLHIFRYSARTGTAAANMPAQVPKAIGQQRSQELHALAASQRQSRLQPNVGLEIPVLWEHGKEQRSASGVRRYRHQGYTPNYFRISTVSDVDLASQVTPTCITGIVDDELVGDVANQCKHTARPRRAELQS